MPNNTDRTSIKTDLESRYKTQPAGEAFNAKLAGTSTVEQSINAKLYDNTQQYVIKESPGASNFKGIVDGKSYKEISRFANNINTTRYHH